MAQCMKTNVRWKYALDKQLLSQNDDFITQVIYCKIAVHYTLPSAEWFFGDWFRPEGNLEPMTQADMERFSEGINNTVQSVVPRLKDFHQLLLLPPKVGQLQITFLSDILTAFAT